MAEGKKEAAGSSLMHVAVQVQGSGLLPWQLPPSRPLARRGRCGGVDDDSS
jgi:hypothetical protein